MDSHSYRFCILVITWYAYPYNATIFCIKPMNPLTLNMLLKQLYSFAEVAFLKSVAEGPYDAIIVDSSNPIGTYFLLTKGT